MLVNLEQTVDKILDQTHQNIESRLSESLQESRQKLDGALVGLEAEYNRIISDGKKEADKIEKQIVGSSDLEARNKELLLVEEAVNRAFDYALRRLSQTDRDGSYTDLVESLLQEAVDALGSADVLVYTSPADKDAVLVAMEKFPDARFAEEIQCLGGVRVVSGDGTMTFDNTLDARISRLKPLIRKKIAAKFEVTQ